MTGIAADIKDALNGINDYEGVLEVSDVKNTNIASGLTELV